MSESELVEKLRAHFEASGYVVASEVNFLLRRIDLVCIHRRTKQVVSVEAKVRDWRRALRQAKTCLLCSDKVLIAVPEGLERRIDLGLLSEWGIGLIVVGSRIRKVMESAPAALVDPVHRSEVVSRLGHQAA
jgi:hypothetical protein